MTSSYQRIKHNSPTPELGLMNRTTYEERFLQKDGLGKVAIGVLLALIILTNIPIKIPSLIPKLFVAGVIIYVLYLLLFRFTGWKYELVFSRAFTYGIIALVTELFIENLLVWVVSATDNRKAELVPGLQDNLELIVLSILKYSPSAEWFMSLKLGNSYASACFIQR
jgi:hypothetical protein